MYDVQSKDGKEWFYTDEVKDHFFNPKNLLKTREEAEQCAKQASGIGEEGSPACGDLMKMWIKVKDNKIIECKWQTFGCASAIASTSMFSEMVKGMKIEKALAIKPQDISKELGGLPARKFHCSVLADKALRAAVNDHYKKTNQLDKIKEDKVKIIDKILKITDHDIEEAVLEGVRTFEELQKRTKIGVQDKTCIPEAEQLLRFYLEKYFNKKQ
ncbi:iron-sulfur cluster assembly scaffold protein [Candidatus Woesearchaeota archaeon]|jgi:nitrogen fixation protein NifU and related proteins|nr:iron-sulfur cluster assembly scaffold protein [Candidatus Woesearchaeota archaeon]MBT7238150.1 iron-sulfur cluster assembly scaffold protein [Candidatus Woesearchaeota archaeon]